MKRRKNVETEIKRDEDEKPDVVNLPTEDEGKKRE